MLIHEFHALDLLIEINVYDHRSLSSRGKGLNNSGLNGDLLSASMIPAKTERDVEMNLIR